MVLIKCHECSERVSDHARKCPRCGESVIATDQQIDALVYELYGLTADEIKLVEGDQ
jgi:Zn finger protein HypA/HybF involved in hydrogenase expression